MYVYVRMPNWVCLSKMGLVISLLRIHCQKRALFKNVTNNERLRFEPAELLLFH